ncbi:MAG TPA: LpxD N-terminal domain-containing protein, partial [Hyphomicrobiales bacterium]|nr:LpxD N-terminal domain-containing protein [Hyphomicrobiales bacterium]
MEHPGFWAPAGPFSLSELGAYADAALPEAFAASAAKPIRSVKALDDAGPSDVSFFENRKYLKALQKTCAGAVFIS